MSYQSKPASSPPCWGIQYSDADAECFQCPFKDTCKPVTINRAASPQPVHVRPPMPSPQAAMVPMPARPYLPVVQPPAQAPVYRPPTPAPQAAPMVQYAPVPQQAPTQYVPTIPDPYNPSPLVPMARPGAAGPPYFFTQYPGESTLERLSKNMALRGAEAIFGELMFFFRHWTWPPRS